jgi:hypothetical protein
MSRKKIPTSCYATLKQVIWRARRSSVRELTGNLSKSRPIQVVQLLLLGRKASPLFKGTVYVCTCSVNKTSSKNVHDTCR